MGKKKPVIVVTYWDHDEPKVAIPDELKDKVTVKIVDGDADDQHVLTYEGVTIYQTIKEDCGDAYIYSDYWYAVESDVPSDSDHAFDVRDLPKIPKPAKAKYQDLFPHETQKQQLAYAIDQGWLFDDALNLPPKPKKEASNA